MNEKPQHPPEIERELVFDGKHLAGLLFILIFPFLALIGILEPGLKSIHLEDKGIEATLEFPYQLRYKKTSGLTLRITNSTETASDIEVHIERSYFRNFSNISFTPDPEYISYREYFFNFPDLEAGESRIIHTELKPEKVGKSGGRISISGLSREGEMRFETLTLP